MTTAGVSAIDTLELIEARDDSAVIGVARGEQALRELVVAIPGCGPKRKRIFLRQVAASDAGAETELKSGLPATGRAECFVQHIQDRCLPASSDSDRSGLLLETDHDVVLRTDASDVSLML